METKVLLIANKPLVGKSLTTLMNGANISCENAHTWSEINEKLKTKEFGLVVVATMMKKDVVLGAEHDVGPHKVIPAVVGSAKNGEPISVVWYGSEEDQADFEFDIKAEYFATTSFCLMSRGNNALLEMIKEILAGPPGTVVGRKERKSSTVAKATTEPEVESTLDEPPGLKFLIVDPSQSFQGIMKTIVREFGYSNISLANTGKEGWDKLQLAAKAGRPFNVVIAEWQIAEIDGLQLLKNVRSDATYTKIPFVMVTTSDAKENVMRALQEKVSQYVVKPFSKETFKGKLGQVLPKSAQAKTAMGA